MPSKSFSQARMMAGAAHDPVFAKKVGVPPKVAKEFNMADKRSGFLKSAMRAKGPAYAEGGEVDAAAALEAEMQKRAEENARKKAEEARKRKRAAARSDTNNPDRQTVTPRVYETPPQYAKGGSVKGRGAESKGIRPAKYY